MSEETNRIALSKKGHRQVTPFTGNELLYDYMSGILDDERKKAVEAYLESSREAQLDFQKIQIGLQYSEKLKQITVSHALYEKMSVQSSYLTVLFQKARFDQWPVGLKWGLEALAVVFVIVTFLTFAPWEKVMKLRLSTGSGDVILTELNKAQPDKLASQTHPQTTDTPEFVDEGIKKPEATPPSVAAVAANKKPEPTVTPTVAKATPTPAATPKKPEHVAAATDATAAVDESSSEEESGETSKPSTGYLYRGQIAVTNVEAIGPKVKEKILELGGRKAGEVELGWLKTPDSAYFHFTIPEAKYEELQAFLSGYGTARISKEKHPRVMPDGIIRLIITVDEAKK